MADFQRRQTPRQTGPPTEALVSQRHRHANASMGDQPSTDPTRHKMGDEGKLPATNSVTTRVPEQVAVTGESSGTSGSHRMGDEGKLPATNGVSTQVPEQGAGTQNPK